MVYKWEAHKEICERLYIEEKKSFRVIAAYMKEHHNFGASERALQCQFRRWGFPSRYKRVRKDDHLVAKVRELWEQNVSQREMHRIVNEEEGYEISSRELLRLRQEHNLMLRGRNGDRPSTEGPDDDDESMAEDGTPVSPGQHQDQNQDQEQAPSGAAAAAAAASAGEGQQQQQPVVELFPAPVKTSPAGKGHNKPRRLTKVFGLRSRDAAGPPRFPSELTLDEAKAILGLDEDSYVGMRAIFTRLCEEAGVIKKTIAGPDRWEGLKDALIRQFPPLEAEMWQSRDNHDGKKLALDVICTDCTKRLRVKNRNLTLPDARVVLGINPEETRQLRASWYKLVEENGVHSKTQAGVKQWNDLKNQWGQRCPIVQRVLTAGNTQSTHEDKLRALELLARDVMKRRWDDAGRAKKAQAGKKASATPSAETAGKAAKQTQTQTQTQQQQASRPGLEPRFVVADAPMGDNPHAEEQDGDGTAGNGQDHMYQSNYPDPQVSAQQPYASPHNPQRVVLDSTLGSSLLMAVNSESAAYQQQQQQQHMSPQQQAAPGPPSTSTAIFLRLSPLSTYETSTSLWIATMSAHSVRELRHVAVEKFPNAACLRVEGILKDGKGGEMPLLIDGDTELEAYLTHLNGATPTFSVQLVPGWRPA
ncbi:hypothetical protein ACHAQF_001308 [Verticillium nonalfalfae]